MVDVLETGDAPIFVSLPQMRDLGMTFELDPQGDKITSPAFGLHSSPAEYSTMGHLALDLTSLTYQPTAKSSDRPGKPRRHASEREQAYPAHTQKTTSEEDDEHLVHQDHVFPSHDEDEQPLVRPASRKKPHKERRDQVTDDGDLCTLASSETFSSCTNTKETGTASKARRICHSGTRSDKELA